MNTIPDVMIIADAGVGKAKIGKAKKLPISTSGFVSWTRLANEVMRESGEISEFETVTRIVADIGGITYYVTR